MPIGLIVSQFGLHWQCVLLRPEHMPSRPFSRPTEPMPQDTTTPANAAQGRSRAAFDSVADRSTAFRKARRHSALVRSLRYLLPLGAVAMLASYGLFMQRSISIGWGDKSVAVDKISISREALVAHNPRYSGFDKNGGEFVIRADTAEQDLKQKSVVRLKAIEGQFVDPGKSRTELRATRGVFDTGTTVLEMYDRIDVVSQNGMNAELTRATVFAKDNRIVSPEPVLVRMPSGIVRGQAMTIEQKRRQILFSGGVSANLKQEARPTAASGTDASLRGTSSIGQPGAPVDITAAQLLIDDAAKTATFGGNVVARQADSVMQTAELEVHYEGQPTGQVQGVTAPGSQSSRLSKLVARSDVVLTRAQEKATGSGAEFDALSDRATLFGPVAITAGAERGATADRAEIDNKNDSYLLTGNVVVTQQKNVLKGRRLRVDRKKGTMELESPAVAGLPKGRISAHLVQGEADGPAKKAQPQPQSQGVASFRGEPGQPILIDADRLDVDDKAKAAVFRGRVVARQGEYVISTEELVAAYTGESGLALGPAGAAQPAGAQPRAAAQLKTVSAPRVVDIVAKDGQRARGNSAVFDTKANIATLNGDVRLTQGTTITTGACARLDMNTGAMRIVDACGFAAAAGASAGQAPAAGKAAPGRAQVLLYPGLLKEQQQKDKEQQHKDKAKAPAPSAAPPPETPARSVRRQGRDEAGSSPFGN